LCVTLYRDHKNADIAEIKADLIYDFVESTQENDFTIKTYEDHNTLLWTDRRYHTDTTIPELVDREFFCFPRDYKGLVVIRCTRRTTVYTMNNSDVITNLQGWRYVKPILVFDKWKPRSFNSLYAKELSEGVYVISNDILHPSATIFYEKGSIDVVP